MGTVGESNFKVEAAERSGKERSNYYDISLRVLGLLLTLVAAVLIGADKETKTVPVVLVETLPPLQVPVIAKWHYLSAFVYLLVTNAIACSYAAGSLIYSLVGRGVKNNNSNATLSLILLDMVIMGLLFSADGAAAAVGVIGRYGNSHVQWKKVCTVFEGYCHQMAGALVLTLLGSFVFLWLVVIAVLDLHRRSMR